MVPLEEVDELLKKCACEVGIDFEPSLVLEKKVENQQEDMHKIKDWLKEPFFQKQ